MAKTILLADDSSTIRKIVELTFSDSEIRVETVESGREALETLDVLRPDLVLADVVMPEPSGYEICRSVKRSGRPVPVVLLAGTFEPFDEQRARECEADDHLVKPFESETLREKVETLLARADAAAAAPAEEPETSAPLPAGRAHKPDPALVDAVAREVLRRLSTDAVREIAREVVPDLAAEIIRERIRELENEDS